MARLFYFDGEALRRAREGQGLSREELAALARCSASAVSRWESGHRTPSGGLVASLAAVLGLSPHALFRTESDEGPTW